MLLIFDCDGPLRSVSRRGMYEAYLAIANHVNIDPTKCWRNVDDFWLWRNNDWHYNLERMGVPRGSDYTQIVRIFHEIYDSSVVKFGWLDEVLDHLAQKQHTLTILSAAKTDGIRASLDSSSSYFSIIKGFDDVQNIKPDPEGIHAIMDEVGIGPDETIMIGDTYADVLAGKNAGVKTVGVTWGMTDLKDMKELEPDFIFEDPMQLKHF